MLSDLRYACRALAGAPWYVATVVSVLALGLALATVAFAVVDGVLFKPLPYRSAHELFFARADVSSVPRVQPPPVGWREVDAWTKEMPAIAVTAVTSALSSSSVVDGRDYWSAGIDERFFDVIGVRPMLGGFAAGDFEGEAGVTKANWRPILASHRFWRTVLAEDPQVLGRTIVVSVRDGITFGWRVAGILPPDFVFPLDIGVPQPDILTPITRSVRERPSRELQVIMRLPALSRPAVVAERLAATTRRGAGTAPSRGHQSADALQWLPFDEVRLLPIGDHLARLQRPAFRLALAGAAVLLLLACVNVAGLAAARHLSRRRDLFIRRALGAGGWMLARGLLAESTVLALLGTGLALLVTAPLLAWTLRLLPASIPLLKVPAVDGRVFAATAVLMIASIVLVTVWPARLAVRRVSPGANGLASTSTPQSRRATFALVSLQIGLGFVLLAGGALTVTSLAKAWWNDTGYRRAHMVLLEVFVSTYADSADALGQLEALDATLQHVAGVERVAFSTIQPLFTRRLNAWTDYTPQGWSGSADRIQSRKVSSRFFDVMGLPLVEGRLPAEGEWNPDQPVALVSQTAAGLLWPGQSAIGRTLVRRPNLKGTPTRTVIGVVADARYSALDEDPKGEIYLPDRMVPGRTGAFFHVRGSEPADVVLARILPVLSSRRLYVTQATTHENALFASVRHRALTAWLFGSLGLASLAIVTTGILGLLAMAASQRTREIGIRCVLGATRGRVVRLLVVEQLAGIVAGLAGGAIVSAWLVGYIQSQLYQVRPYDPLVWTGVAATLLIAAALGTVLPSIRAARVDPVRVLHVD